MSTRRSLLPRLPSFAAAPADVDIRIDASDELVDLAAAGLDVAIRNCRTDQAPHNAIRLMDQELIPALAPQLAGERPPPRVRARIACGYRPPSFSAKTSPATRPAFTPHGQPA